MARGRGIASPESRKRAQTAARESRQRLENKFREDTREKFFKGREDVSDDRLDRRRQQEKEYERFKRTQMELVPGTTNLFQSRTPGGPTLADKAQELAFKYGPTFREIGSDIGYGIGSIGRGLGDFIGRGGVIGSILSDIYGRVKGGAQQGIETVGGLYDNLRSAFSGQPTVNYGGGSTMLTTTNERPRVDLTPTSIDVETLPSINLGEESDPSIFGITNTGVSLPFLRSTVDLPYNNISSFNPDTYQPGYLPEGFSNVGIENPLFRSVSYEPIRVSDMDMTGVTAQNERPVLPSNVVPMMRVGEPMNIDQYRTPVLPPDITDPRLYQNQVLFAKDGGSVDKYAGLGYKLK